MPMFLVVYKTHKQGILYNFSQFFILWFLYSQKLEVSYLSLLISHQNIRIVI